MKLTLLRKYYKDDYTIGHLFADGVFVCDTLEDPVRDLQRSSDKIPGETAIPFGSYSVSMTISPRFRDSVWGIHYGGVVPAIDGVKYFSGVRIHPGNKAKDTSGCPLVGYNKIKGGLTDSVKAYYKLMDEFLVPAHRRGEQIEIEIV